MMLLSFDDARDLFGLSVTAAVLVVVFYLAA